MDLLAAMGGEKSLTSAVGRWRRHVDHVLNAPGAYGTVSGALGLLESCGGEVSLNNAWGNWARELSKNLDDGTNPGAIRALLLDAALPKDLEFQWSWSALTNIPDLILEAMLWYDPALIQVSGADVSGWVNRGSGGNQWDLVAGANAPTYSATGGEGGGPCVDFEAASVERLVSAAITFNQPNTVFIKAAYDILTGTVCDGRTGNTRRHYMTGTQNGAYAGASLACTTGSLVSTWYSFGGVYNGASSVVGRYNNAGFSTEVSGNAGTVSASGLVLGDFGLTGGGAFDGQVEEVLAWSRVLDATERAQVVTWLNRNA